MKTQRKVPLTDIVYILRYCVIIRFSKAFNLPQIFELAPLVLLVGQLSNKGFYEGSAFRKYFQVTIQKACFVAFSMISSLFHSQFHIITPSKIFNQRINQSTQFFVQNIDSGLDGLFICR